MSTVAEIEQAALSLSESQRARLAASLLESLPALGGHWTEAAELEEAERREREIEQGQVRPLTEQELWQRIHAERKT